MAIFSIKLTRQMEIIVTVKANTQDAAESEALGLAEAVGYTNLSPEVQVYLDREANIVGSDEL